MRHVLLPRTPATAPRRMGQPTAPACLIALAGHPLGLLPRFLRAAAGTVNLAAVATAADQRLDPAARTQEQPGRAFRQIGLDRAWTASAAGGILPRHACSAPCEARRRTRTWRFRSAPCLPFSKWSSAPLCSRHRCDAAIAPAARDHLWICGQRKGVAHIPTGSATSASISWIHLEGAQAQPSPGHRSAVDPQGRSFASASNCAIFARIQTAIHKGLRDRQEGVRSAVSVFVSATGSRRFGRAPAVSGLPLTADLWPNIGFRR
jgi:hypothetical protein